MTAYISRRDLNQDYGDTTEPSPDIKRGVLGWIEGSYCHYYDWGQLPVFVGL